MSKGHSSFDEQVRMIWIFISSFAVGYSSNQMMCKNRFSHWLIVISTKVISNAFITNLFFVFSIIPVSLFNYLTNISYLYHILALEWISKNGEAVVTVSTLTTIRGILGHLRCCNSKKQFVNGLLKGGGANLNSQSLILFGQMVHFFFNWETI